MCPSKNAATALAAACALIILSVQASDLVIGPWGALTTGMAAGLLSVMGYTYIQPYLARTIGLDDTCGVHNLHGMPGVMGGIAGIISAASTGTAKCQ